MNSAADKDPGENLWAFSYRLERNAKPFTAESVKADAPAEPGVYAIWAPAWAQDIGCLYVGKSKNMRSRLLQHLNDAQNDALYRYIRDYQGYLMFTAEPAASDTQAKAIESAMIRRLEPECNIAENR